MRYSQKKLDRLADEERLIAGSRRCPLFPCRRCDARAAAVASLPATLFQAQLRYVNACLKARVWVDGKTAREAYNTCTRVEWLRFVVVEMADYPADSSGWDYDRGRALTPDEYRAKWPFERFAAAVAAHTEASK